jgi:hypothetical protein
LSNLLPGCSGNITIGDSPGSQCDLVEPNPSPTPSKKWPLFSQTRRPYLSGSRAVVVKRRDERGNSRRSFCVHARLGGAIRLRCRESLSSPSPLFGCSAQGSRSEDPPIYESLRERALPVDMPRTVALPNHGAAFEASSSAITNCERSRRREMPTLSK